jgi:hypothetical protein
MACAPEKGAVNMGALVRYDAMCRAIDAAYAVDEVKAIHDQAAMLQAAARVAHNVEAETRAPAFRVVGAETLNTGLLLLAGKTNGGPCMGRIE